MNPDTKLIIEEMSKRFDALEARWESRLSERDGTMDQKIADLESSHGGRLSALELSASSLPAIEGTVDDIRLEVNKLSKHWERAVLERAQQPPLRPIPPAPEFLPSPGFATKPSGHHVDTSYRVDDHGVVTTMAHHPVKGTIRLQCPSSCA